MLYLVCLELVLWVLRKWRLEISEICSMWGGESVAGWSVPGWTKALLHLLSSRKASLRGSQRLDKRQWGWALGAET